MSVRELTAVTTKYHSMNRAPHSLHECGNAEEFLAQFPIATGCSVEQVTDEVVAASIPKAVFLVGSLPLGMATQGSDIDLIALVDDRSALPKEVYSIINTGQRLAFSSDSDSLRAGSVLRVVNGIMVDVTVVVTPAVKRIFSRLRTRGPELNDNEILTLGRLHSGWLLWQSEDYLEKNGLTLTDSALDVYCCTRSFVSALHLIQKGANALEITDIPLALQLGRASVEAAYLAYFASEGFSYLGPKWLALLGKARGAADRVSRYPLLQQGIALLFPRYTESRSEVGGFLEAASNFLFAIRQHIEQKTLFRIAFNACPQIHTE